MLRNSREHTLETDSRDDLFDLVKSHIQTEAQADYLSKLLSLSARKVELLRDKIARLKAMQMLDAEVLALVIERVSFKPAKVALCDAEFKKEGKGHLVALKQGPSFFTSLKKPKNKYSSGGFGYVCQAAANQDDDTVVWGVKVMHAGTKSDFKTAQHEARYNRMMGRECFMFKFHHKPCLLIDWQNGVPLNQLEAQNKLGKYSFRQRLQWLISLLEDVNKMHQHYFVHFDLQAKNVVVDTENNKMRLIDYGISHRECIAVPRVEGFDETFSVGEDMRDLAEHIIRILFDNEWHQLKDIPSQAIRDLYTAVRYSVIESGCTSEQALHYCQQLLDNLDGLNKKKLAAIQAETIHRNDFTVEDVLRGRKLV